MLALRVCGAALLALCGWAAGWAAAQRAARRRAALEDTIALLERLRQEIDYKKLPLSAALAALRRENAFAAIPLADCPSLQQLAPPAALNGEEKACFSACFSALGHSGSAQECQRLSYYLARFRGFLAAAAQQEAQARQLWPRLGLSIGAMFAVASL